MTGFKQTGQEVGNQNNAENITINNTNIYYSAPLPELEQLATDTTEGTLEKDELELKSSAREERQARQFKKMCEIIEGQNDVLTAFSCELKARFPEEKLLSIDAKSVITSFNKFPDDNAIECIEEVFCRLCDDKNYTQAEVVGHFAEAFLPVLFEYDNHLDSFRAELKNSTNTLIESPTNLPVPTETMMAEAENKQPQLKLVSNKLVSPLDLGSLAEIGLDESNAEAKRQIEKLLSSRLLNVRDQAAFESSVDAVTYDIARRKDHAGALAGKVAGVSSRASVSRILKNIFRIKRRRFYYCFKAAEEFDPKMMVQLGQDYPLLVFLLSRCTDENLEEERYSFLSHIIAVGKGASISEELE